MYDCDTVVNHEEDLELDWQHFTTTARNGYTGKWINMMILFKTNYQKKTFLMTEHTCYFWKNQTPFALIKTHMDLAEIKKKNRLYWKWQKWIRLTIVRSQALR